MDSFVAGTFIWLYFAFWLAIFLLPMIFFFITQQKALTKCSPGNRTMSPGLVWLQIIPVFGFVWQFFVVIALANSLSAEFRARGIYEEDNPGQGVGIAMCITRLFLVVPVLNILAGIASLVLWIVYWVKIAGFSGKLDSAPLAYGQSPYGTPPYGTPGYGAPGYGASNQAPYQAPYGQRPAGITPQITTPANPADAAAAAPAAGDSAPAAPICATCGATLASDSTFCQQCGARVS
jgi:ribosomal protein L40E